MPIQIPLPNLTGFPKTQVSTTIQAGATAIPIFDGDSFVNNQYVVVGTLGMNGCEEVLINNTVTANSLPVGALKYPHVSKEEVIFSPFNQWQVYRSTNSGVSFNLLATVAIQWNQIYTVYFDTTGQTQYQYYAVPFNSNTGWSGTQSAIVPGSGYSYASFFKLRERARIVLRDSGAVAQFSDGQLDMWINDTYVEMQRVLSNINKNWYLKDSSFFTFISGQQEYALPIDCKIPLYVWASGNSAGTNLYSVTMDRMQRIFDQQYATSTQFNNINFGYVSNAYLSGTNIGFFPIPQNGGYKLRYVPISTQLVNDTDVMVTPLNEYVDYMDDGLLYKAYKKKDKDKSDGYKKSFTESLVLMAGELSKRQMASDTMMGASDNLFLSPFIDDSYGPDYYGDFN